MASKHTKKVFTATYYQGNTNRNDRELSPHISEMAYIKKLGTSSTGREVVTKSSSFTAAKNVVWLHLYENSLGISQKS